MIESQFVKPFLSKIGQEAKRLDKEEMCKEYGKEIGDIITKDNPTKEEMELLWADSTRLSKQSNQDKEASAAYRADYAKRTREYQDSLPRQSLRDCLRQMLLVRGTTAEATNILLNGTKEEQDALLRKMYPDLMKKHDSQS